jgi:hypothetical protein
LAASLPSTWVWACSVSQVARQSSYERPGQTEGMTAHYWVPAAALKAGPLACGGDADGGGERAGCGRRAGHAGPTGPLG